MISFQAFDPKNAGANQMTQDVLNGIPVDTEVLKNDIQ